MKNFNTFQILSFEQAHFFKSLMYMLSTVTSMFSRLIQVCTMPDFGPSEG